jgi:HAD superfamily hydrolase (TIGR01509 family)
LLGALIFDFDGVILDTETPEFQSWQEVFADHGSVLTIEVWAQAIGAGRTAFDIYGHLASVVGRPIDADSIRAVRRPRNDFLLSTQSILPGVESWIGAAKQLGFKLGVASSSTSEWVEAHLLRLGLREAFGSLRCADHVERTKPDPELYVSVLADLGVRPRDAIAIEDSPNGITAAKRAGLFCIAVPNSVTTGLDLSQADLRLSSLADLSLEGFIARAR